MVKRGGVKGGKRGRANRGGKGEDQGCDKESQGRGSN